MNDSLFSTIVSATVLMVISTMTSAELIDRGGGMIYDSDQDLTWMQNANVNGVMTWDAAMAWADSLDFGGFDDWRLPVTTQFDDPTCPEDVRGDYDLIFEHHIGCLNGEMEYLTAFELYDAEDPAGEDPFANELFFNIETETRYWTATPYRDGMDPCVEGGYCRNPSDNGIRTDFYWQWGFAGDGDITEPFKTTLRGGNPRFAWAVRDGDVIAHMLPGDINFDDQVNVADYLMLTQFVLGTGPIPTPTEFTAGDMNLNDRLDAGDLVILSRTIMGLM